MIELLNKMDIYCRIPMVIAKAANSTPCQQYPVLPSEADLLETP